MKTSLKLLAALAFALPHAASMADDSAICRWNIQACKLNGELFGRAYGVVPGAAGGSVDVKSGCSGNQEFQWKGIYNQACSYRGPVSVGEGGVTGVQNTQPGVAGSLTLQCKGGQLSIIESSTSCGTASSTPTPFKAGPLVTAYMSPANPEAGELYTINWTSTSDEVKNVLFECDGVDGLTRRVIEGGSGSYLMVPQGMRHVNKTTWCRVVPYGELDNYQRAMIWVNSPEASQVQAKPLVTDTDRWGSMNFNTKPPSAVIIERSTDNHDGSYMVMLSDGTTERRVRLNADGQVVDINGNLMSRQDLLVTVKFAGIDYGVPSGL